jgi:hypothetical protein
MKGKHGGVIFEKEINLDIEQSIKIFSKMDNWAMFIVKEYPLTKHSAQAVKRQREKRKAKGYCSYLGCPNKAKKGYGKCKYHIEMDRLKKRVRL